VPTTPVFALRYPTTSNAANVPLDIGNLATDVDNALNTQVAALTSVLVQKARLVKWGQRTTISPTAASTAYQPVLRVDGVSLVSGSLYLIEYAVHPDSTVTTDNIKTQIQLNTAGVATTASGTVLSTTALAVPKIPRHWASVYAPGANGTGSFLLSFTRDTGSGNCTLFAGDGLRTTDLMIWELGAGSNVGVTAGLT